MSEPAVHGSGHAARLDLDAAGKALAASSTAARIAQLQQIDEAAAHIGTRLVVLTAIPC